MATDLHAWAPSDDVAAIRRAIDHPVIDGDGHLLEVRPVVLDIVRELAGTAVMERLRRYDARLAIDGFVPARTFNAIPAEHTLDRMTVTLPKLLYARLDEIGIDFSLLYPSFGLTTLANPDEELRQATARALNTYYARTFDGFRDRLEPVAVIPMFTPDEAVAELEYAVEGLGLKAVVMSSVIPRIGVPDDPAHAWIDTLGHGSRYDYDPVWAKCDALGVTPAFHGVGYGWGTRASATNYVYNHLGNFAAAQEAVCRSLVMGGVPRRFPNLRFVFLEGGVAWAAQLYSDLLGHFEKRNRDVVGSYSDTRIDRGLAARLHAEWGTGAIADLGGRFDESMQRAIESATAYEAAHDPVDFDDFAESGIGSAADIVDMFSRQFAFGCEADDPMNALAFDRAVLPHGIALNAVFASDIGHWDVPDIRDVLPEAWELVEHHHLDADNFRDFTCGNIVRALTATNPSFFVGTTVSGIEGRFG